MKIAAFARCLLIATTLSSPALAQSDNSLAMERMERLERDLQLLQRQVARGESAPASSGSSEPITNAAQVEVRISQIEDQMRELRGRIEETQNEVRKVAENLDRFQKDTEFRLSQQPASPPVAIAASAPAAPVPAAAPPAPPAPPAAAPAPVAAAADDKKLKTNFPTPRDHYNYAFRLLNQTQYEQAAASFDDFTNKYPKDPLIGNAYYWGGETYYIRRDYVKAADYFRLGYEAMPEGPKAADNLYKLALTLNALEQEKEACVVLQQVVAKFKKTATNITAKAEQEIKNSGCRTK